MRNLAQLLADLARSDAIPVQLAGVVAQLRPAQTELAGDAGTVQAYCTIRTGPGGFELAGEIHALTDLQAVRVERGAGVVAQLGIGAIEVASDRGTFKVDCAPACVADDLCH